MYGLCKCVCMQQGDMLAVSPYESHHDPRFFQPHPARYDPTRAALQCPGSSLHEVPGISGIAGLVFGGGRYRSALTLRHPRWPMQHHISHKREPTMQHCTTPLWGSAWKPVVLSRCLTVMWLKRLQCRMQHAKEGSAITSIADPHSGFAFSAQRSPIA